MDIIFFFTYFLSLISYNAGSIFLTIHFKHFDFIEWFDLNSNPKSLFERSPISDFLVDSSVDLITCMYIWFIRLLMLKSGASGLALITVYPWSYIYFCPYFSYSGSFSTWAYSWISITSLYLGRQRSGLLFWIQYWVCIISPSNSTCNMLLISYSSKLCLQGLILTFLWILKIVSMLLYDFFFQLNHFVQILYMVGILHQVLIIVYFFVFWITFIKNHCPIFVIWFYF